MPLYFIKAYSFRANEWTRFIVRAPDAAAATAIAADNMPAGYKAETCTRIDLAPNELLEV